MAASSHEAPDLRGYSAAQHGHSPARRIGANLRVESLGMCRLRSRPVAAIVSEGTTEAKYPVLARRCPVRRPGRSSYAGLASPSISSGQGELHTDAA